MAMTERVKLARGIARLIIEGLPIMVGRAKYAQFVREDMKNPAVREAVIRALKIRREKVNGAAQHDKRVDHSQRTFPQRPTTGISKPPRRPKPPRRL